MSRNWTPAATGGIRRLSSIGLWGLFLLCASAFASAGEPFQPATRWRRPVAVVSLDNGAALLVANRDSGSISHVDVDSGLVIDEFDVGQRLADLAITPDGQSVLAVDEVAGELIVLSRQALGGSAARVRLPASPVSVAIAPDGRRCFVASLWGQCVSVVELASDPASAEPNRSPRVTASIKLPFCPRAQRLLPDGRRLVVADAFGGELALVDVETAALVGVRTVPGHNLRGLAMAADGEHLLIAHQVLNGRAETIQGNVYWGSVVGNLVRSLPLASLGAPGDAALTLGSTQAIGTPGHAAGDPAAVVVAPSGDVLLALAGVNEVALRRAGQNTLLRMKTGRRPTALALDPLGGQAFVANMLGDSVSVIDLEAGQVARTIDLGPKPPLTAAQRGELLFYSARLSLDGWYSCHSCHVDGHTNGLTSDTLGDESLGAPKRVPSLLGTAATGPWGWDGHFQRLEDQVRSSIHTTMRGRQATEQQVTSLVAFLETLPPPPPPEPAASDAAALGGRVFERSGCAACHAAPAYTSKGAYDVGLFDELGQSEFNPPALRGVAWRGRLFHDNRAAGLEEVFGRHRHQLDTELAPDELRGLLAFLRSL